MSIDKPDYERRCARCEHDLWQNDYVGDCQVHHRDVLHHVVLDCPDFKKLSTQDKTS